MPKAKKKPEADKRPPGRPPKEDALVRSQQDTLLERHAQGETITRITREMGLSIAAPWRWSDADPDGFGKRYARARAEHAHAAAASAVDIADGEDALTLMYEEGLDERRDEIVDMKEGPAKSAAYKALAQLESNLVQRDRMRMDARKWYTAKALPRIYGDKVDVTSNGESLAPLIPANERNARVAALLAKVHGAN